MDARNRRPGSRGAGSRATPRIVVRQTVDGLPSGPAEPLLPSWSAADQTAGEPVRPRRREARRRGRHAAPPAEPRFRVSVPSNRASLVITVLATLVIAGLGFGPLLARVEGDFLASRVLLVVATVVCAPVIAVICWRRRPDFGLALVAACTSFLLGLGCLSIYSVLGLDPILWQLGHVMLVVSVPLLGLGIHASQPRWVPRPRAFTVLVVDSAMVACAWLTLLWREFLWQGQIGLGEAPWGVLWVLGVDLFLLSVLLLMAGLTVDIGVIASALATLLLTINDTVVAGRVASATGTVEAGAPYLLLAWPLLIVAGVTFAGRRRRRGGIDPDAEQRTGLFTLVNVLVPVGVTFGGLAATLEADRTTVLFAGLVVLAFGIRELVRARQAAGLVELLADQAMHDPLTELSNRRALSERLRELSASSVPITVLTLDVDRFKLVNTEFGHSIGDEVLAAVGAALRETCGPLGAQPFRLGGDEFAVVAVGDSAFGLKLAERVRAAVVEHTKQVPGVENLGLTASVGVAPLQRGGDPLAVLGRSAEALRVAKQERNRVRQYTDDLLDEANRRNQLETRLRRAIDLRDVEFHYQPIVDLRSGRIMGMESLARWVDSELGVVSPVDFVPMAEQTGLIHDLGRLAIEAALRVAVGGAPGDARLSYVAVNVSPLQLRRPQFVEEVTSLLKAQHARPSMLKLEVTEGIFMDTDDPAVDNLRRLSELGIGIAIDDFGSGYSSLGYMSRLPIETVKVDRVLTSQVDDSRTRSVVKALVWVAEAHGLQVILEGVETEQTAAALRRLGVRWGQGWLWSRAVPEREVPGVIATLGTVPVSARRRPATAGTIRLP